ncbi:MAG: hypothetical protein U0800_13080 [Isosphaeraceae bacterium]
MTALTDGIDPQPPQAEARLPRWTIRRAMAVVAIVAALCTLARIPFAFGLVVPAGVILAAVADGIRRKHYARVAWIACLLPALPIATLYIHWALAGLGLARRYSAMSEGVLGASEILVMFGLLAYVGIVGLAIRGGEDPYLRRASRWAAFLMPPTWFALLGFLLWDPFGMMDYFFR